MSVALEQPGDWRCPSWWCRTVRRNSGRLRALEDGTFYLFNVDVDAGGKWRIEGTINSEQVHSWHETGTSGPWVASGRSTGSGSEGAGGS